VPSTNGAIDELLRAHAGEQVAAEWVEVQHVVLVELEGHLLERVDTRPAQ
jgi:hypothetical protein